MVGTSLGHFRILRELGKGGMGEVYLAEDTKLGRQVALKLLPEEITQNADRRSRFQREARAVAALNHPHIVTVHSVEEIDGRAVLVLEYVRGKTLGEMIPRGGFPLARVLELAIPLADAVAAAHRRGVIHRDLKPGNVMVDEDGKAYVLEINSAPSQTSPYRQECVAKAFVYIQENGREIIPLGSKGKYLRYIHPALDEKAIK